MQDVRDFLINSLERDIVGPSWKPDSTDPNNEEELDLGERGQPDRYYLTGYLSPLRREVDGTNQFMGSVDEIPPDEMPEISEDMKRSEFNSQRIKEMDEAGGEQTFLSPSTLGLTCLPESETIEIELSWGRYEPSGTVWKRTEETFLRTLDPETIPHNEEQEEEIQGGALLYLRRGSKNHPTLTVRLVNQQIQTKGKKRSEVTLFQPRIEVRQKSPFSDVRREEEIFEDKTMTVLYHDSTIKGQGHNVGVDWSDEGNTLWTTFIPRFEVPKMGKRGSLDDHVPEMKYLIDEDKISEGLQRLHGLVNAYDKWINDAEKSLSSPKKGSVLEREEIQQQIGEHISTARSNANRMRLGIRFLEEDGCARNAFRLANESIRFSQDEPDVPDVKERLDDDGNFIHFKWFPFQIAFQILNIKGLCALEEEDSGRDERDIIDLAWFPTGGGKTEAYLGLISIIGFYRRLRFPEKELRPSIHVIMRYTLRLLTSDQADRLVRLVVGMNRVANDLGSELGANEHEGKKFPPFRVGMWVGNSVSPNDLLNKRSSTQSPKYNAQDAIASLRRGDEEGGEGSVIQFETCPWCGSGHHLGISNPANWQVTQGPSSGQYSWAHDLNGKPTLHGRCRINDSECNICNDSDRSELELSLSEGADFALTEKKQRWQEGTCAKHMDEHITSCELQDWIPFTCVDDDIYLNPPSILLATADKFVQLANNPWPKSVHEEDSHNARNNDCRSMLGFDHLKGGIRPPDLIIQDELHLLTGPLGTLAGLVETGLDVVWRKTNHKPKYVAATATIRGASRDARLMYGRELNVFPPPVKDADDNFFAKANKKKGKGRVHIGVLGPPGKDQTLFSQPAASLLQRAHEIVETNPDIEEYLFDPYWTLVAYFNSLRELGSAQSAISNRVPEFTERYSLSGSASMRQFNEEPRELTSRRTASELKAQKAALKQMKGQIGAVDTVVTTNMFQVGIDIPRLGLMIINGQPRSNSEYIQSSGRVGRKHPGLVVSLLRSKYPRDQSHFEGFRSFHQEMYRHVDVTSTTPFSVRSLDRGMATVLALLMRMGIEDISGRKDLKRLCSAEVKRDARGLYRGFKRQLRDRQDLIGAPNQITLEAEQSLGRMYEYLLSFSADPSNSLEGGTGEAWWRVWTEGDIAKAVRRGDPRPVGWLKSTFLPDNVDGIHDDISSLRDVAEEIAAGRRSHTSKPWWNHIGSIPEGHFFTQCTPGGIWEKDGQSYLTMGVNEWLNGPSVGDQTALHPLSEGGLRIDEDSITTLMRDESLSLRLLPKSGPPRKSNEHGAVSYRRFPRDYGYVCSLGHLSVINKQEDDGSYRCTRYGCEGENGIPRRATPTRWVSVCNSGHLHPFDYWSWAHQGTDFSCSRESPIDLIKDKYASYTLAGWRVVCTVCEEENDMQRVPHITEENGPKCKGWRPWLGEKEAVEICEERLVHRQMSSVSVTYNDTSSIMLLPLSVSWSFAQKSAVQPFKDLLTVDQMKKAFETFPPFKTGLIRALHNSSYLESEEVSDRFFQHLEEYLSLHDARDPLMPENLRVREAKGLRYSDETRYGDTERFDCRPVVGMTIQPPDSWNDEDWPVDFVSRADRLTELQYITGLSRIQPTNETQDIDLRDQGKFGIARYNHGEGIYIQIKPSWLQNAVERRNAKLKPEHANMLLSQEKFLPSFRDQMPCLDTPNGSNALTVLHTLSHLIIKQLCGMSGYSLGSIRERLYLDVDENGDVKLSAILLYTSGPSSDGTLGGLVSQATTRRIEKAVERALASRNDCSNDPVCFNHEPVGEERNGAACHTCILLPETSCELRNFSLDRNWC